MLTLSLKPQVEAMAYPPSFVRFSVTTAGYREVFTKYPFFLYTWNSLVVAAGSTALGLAVGLPAAYSIARWRQQRLAVVILVARIIPGIAYLIPWYIFFRRLRMVDTYGALILTHLIVSLPIIIWVMISFFEDVPSELEDAALIDGCSYLGVFGRIALPLLRPTLVVAILFRSIDALKTFDIIFIMTQGGPANASETINILLFNQAFSYFNMGYASSMAVALFAVVMGVSLILIKMRRTAAW